MLKYGLTIIIIINLFTTLKGQEGIPKENSAQPEAPRFEMSRMHSDGMMMREKEIILRQYSEDVAIFNFPDYPLANGKDEADKFWTSKFENKGDIITELVDFYEIGDTHIVRYRVLKGESLDPEIAVVILRFTNTKISGVYFVDP